MNFNDDQNYILNLKLMKITGLYQLISPRTSKYFGFNLYKVVAAAEVMAGLLSMFMLILSSYYCRDDTNELMKHIMGVMATFFSTLKIFWLSNNSKRIWSNIDMTSINFLTYPSHKKEIFQNGRTKSILITIFFVIFWATVCFSWCVDPSLHKDVYFNVKFKDEIRQFRYNTINYIYPISDEFYNIHFLYFYVVEVIQLTIWCHGFISYDTFVISLCISIEYQLKTISASYTSVNDTKGKLNSNELSAYKFKNLTLK